MNQKTTKFFLGSLIAALMLSAAFAGSAVAGPQWKFNGKALEGEEVIVGAAEKSALKVPGLTTTCDNFLYEIAIKNSGGTGTGSITDLPLFNCYTNTVCTVETITPEGFPWKANLKTISTSNYIIIEGIHVFIEYGNPKCAAFETETEVEGSAGGLINNTTESAEFNAASFKATATQLKTFSNVVEWEGVFPTEAFKWHRDEPLTVS